MNGADARETVRQLASLARSEYEGTGGDLSGTDLIARSEQAATDVVELIDAATVLLAEWDRQDSGGLDPMPAKDWFAAEARFRAAIARATGETI